MGPRAAEANPNSKPRRLQERGQRTCALILSCAEVLFAQHGYTGTSLDAIAAEASRDSSPWPSAFGGWNRA